MSQNVNKWKPGESGNPKGRPKSSRNFLTDKVIKDISTHWKRHGVKALNLMYEKDPSSYVRAVTSLIPKDVQLQTDINVNFIDAIKEIEDRVRLEGEVAVVEVEPSQICDRSVSGDSREMAEERPPVDN